MFTGGQIVLIFAALGSAFADKAEDVVLDLLDGLVPEISRTELKPSLVLNFEP